jgi:hypothetical protein
MDTYYLNKSQAETLKIFLRKKTLAESAEGSDVNFIHKFKILKGQLMRLKIEGGM